MKLTHDISTSPHAAATQVGDETVIVIMSRDPTLALAAKWSGLLVADSNMTWGLSRR